MGGPETLIGEVRAVDLDRMVIQLRVPGRPGHLRASFRPSLEGAARAAVGESVLVRGYRGRGADFWIDELIGGPRGADEPSPELWSLEPAPVPTHASGRGLSHGEIAALLSARDAS